MQVITAKGLSMSYRVPVRKEGLSAAIASIFSRTYRHVEAVKGIDFTIHAGEVVGFIGPNGAGKTTTLKMLSGILHPTAGEASVLGYTPWKREREFLSQIAMIRGSRPLSVPGELTVMDALKFQQKIYGIPDDSFKMNLAELCGLLDLEDLLNRQARALSLGERMRAGLASALVYRPRVLFMDEPTIGLDVTGTATMRRFIADYAKQTKAAVLLTSHYMADIQTLCPQVILIDRGQTVYRGELRRLIEQTADYKLIHLHTDNEVDFIPEGVVLWDRQPGNLVFRVSRSLVPEVTYKLLQEYPISDLTVEDPPLDAVMNLIYRDGVSD